MVRRFPKSFEVFDLVVLGFWGSLLLLHALFQVRIREAGLELWPLLTVDLTGLLLVAATARYCGNLSSAHRLLVRVPLLIGSVFGGFWAVGHSIHAMNPNDVEPYLLVLDRLLWGATFGEWVEPSQQAWLTDLLQMCYASYYFLPLVLFILLYARNRTDQARILATSIVLAFLSNFLLYVAFPARSPYVVAVDPTMAHLVQFTGPLQGNDITHWLRASIEAAEFNMRDCFPSGHTYISLVTLICCWRFERRLFPVYAAIISGLIFGTLYLRYHYVIDLVAGALAAFLVTRWVPRWCERWNRR